VSDNLPDADKVGRALKFLAETDVEYAQLLASKEAVKEDKARILAIQKVASGEKSDAAKTTEALASDEYKDWLERWEDVVFEVEKLKAIRLLACLNIDVWRSLNAARNKGQIV